MHENQDLRVKDLYIGSINFIMEGLDLDNIERVYNYAQLIQQIEDATKAIDRGG